MNEGYLINNFLPFRLGELGRALLLGGETGLGRGAGAFDDHHRTILRSCHCCRVDHIATAFRPGRYLGETGGDRHVERCFPWIRGALFAGQKPRTS